LRLTRWSREKTKEKEEKGGRNTKSKDQKRGPQKERGTSPENVRPDTSTINLGGKRMTPT